MEGDSPPPSAPKPRKNPFLAARINADIFESFRMFVFERHRGRRGGLKKELERAMRYYMVEYRAGRIPMEFLR